MKKLFEGIIKMIEALFKKELNDIIKSSADKVICKYRVIDDINKKAEGDLFFNGEIFRFVSGGAGKGYAPKGNYKAYADQLKLRPEDAYTQFKFGWVLPIGPQFETERTALMIHPDGGKPNVTLGCIGLNFSSLDENVKCYNMFRDYFEKKNILDVEIV